MGYMWHVMNPDEIVNEKAKPYLKEMGPYVFKEFMERVDVQHHPNHTLTFHQNRTWIFAPELSQGNSLEDNITSLNIPVIMAQENTRGKYWDSFMLDSTFAMIDATLLVNYCLKDMKIHCWPLLKWLGPLQSLTYPWINLDGFMHGIKLPGVMENSACTLEKIIPPKSVKFPVGTTKPELIMKVIVAKFVDQPVAFSLQTSKVTLWKCFPMRLVQH